ncbi:hypothetical protein UPYG_G00063940 [Umbra pygmaea]|uniref:GATA-type domain-containing protein n=1 Tax=Umbra pygmaea TaxID=75934 RepID=A0ABD0XD92_UMBPY
MSTGATYRPEKRGTKEDPDSRDDQQVTQSTILYLIHEATKLATPSPVHNGSMDVKPTSLNVSNSRSKKSIVSDHSPWEVMSLINMQCERILHSGNPQEEASSTVQSGPLVYSHKVAPLAVIISDTSTLEEMDYHGKTVCPPLLHTTGDSLYSPFRSRGERGKLSRGGEYSPRSPGTNLPVVSSSYSTEPGKGDPDSEAATNKDTGVTFCLGGDGFPVNEESRKISYAIVKEEPTLMESCPQADDGLSFKHQSVSIDDQFEQPLDNHIATGEDAACQSSQSLGNTTRIHPGPEELNLNMTLDFNSNICFTFDPKDDIPQLAKSPQEMLLSVGTEPVLVTVNPTSGQDVSLIKTQADCIQSCVVTNEEELLSIPPNPQSHCEPTLKVTKTPRKQANPSRSADVRDPDFQGVTFSMQTELDDRREQCRLLITSKEYRDEIPRGRTRRSVRAGRARSSQSSLRTSSSEEESDPSILPKNKRCASCCTKKTPLWRDAEDGTPLCNACGIRYKKYRVRCLQCWHIPRKEGNSNACCFKCGDLLHLASSQRKHSPW